MRFLIFDLRFLIADRPTRIGQCCGPRAATINNQQSKITNPRGVVLLVVLIVVAMLALGAYSFTQLMNVEARGAQSYGRLVQAREAADSGVHFVAAILMDQKLNGMLGSDVYDASGMLHGQVVTDESAGTPRLRCRFSAVAPLEAVDGSDSVRFGLTDEAGKINLNTVLQMLQTQGGGSGGGTSGGGGTGTGGGTGSEATNPLLYLPNMTPEIADAILDWIDEDDTARDYGAESEYYQSLNPPYLPRNGPISSLDELLLVAGVTPRLLYGEDANRNGVLDPNEDDGDLSNPSDDSSGTLDRGWLPYLTLYSREQNTDLWGTARINLNSNDLQALYDELAADEDFGEDKAKFIIAYRLTDPASSGQQGQQQSQQQGQSQQGQQGTSQQTGQDSRSTGQQQNSQSTGQQSTGQPSTGQQPTQQASTQQQSGQSSSSTQATTIAGMDASGGSKQKITSVTDLIGTSAYIKAPGQQQTTELKSPFLETELDDFLDTLLDRTTTVESKEIPGRINVNTAPWPVFLALPGMTEEMADTIISARGQADTSSEALANQGVAWLLTSGSVTKAQFKQLEPFITGQTQVFRVQVTGYYEQGGQSARVEAVIDVSGSSPRIRSWRDLTGLGRGFDPQLLMQTVSH